MIKFPRKYYKYFGTPVQKIISHQAKKTRKPENPKTRKCKKYMFLIFYLRNEGETTRAYVSFSKRMRVPCLFEAKGTNKRMLFREEK